MDRNTQQHQIIRKQFTRQRTDQHPRATATAISKDAGNQCDCSCQTNDIPQNPLSRTPNPKVPGVVQPSPVALSAGSSRLPFAATVQQPSPMDRDSYYCRRGKPPAALPKYTGPPRCFGCTRQRRLGLGVVNCTGLSDICLPVRFGWPLGRGGLRRTHKLFDAF